MHLEELETPPGSTARSTVWGFDDAGPAFGTFVSADRMWPDRVPCLRQLRLPKPPHLCVFWQASKSQNDCKKAVIAVPRGGAAARNVQTLFFSRIAPRPR